MAMADLCAMLEALGMSDVRSALQSGNLVFGSERTTAAKLETLLEAAAKKRLRLETLFLVRSAPEWAQVVARNPFPDEARRDPGRLVVHFLKAAPRPAAVKALQAAIVGRETVRSGGRQSHVYVYYPDGTGRSKVPALVGKHLGTNATARSWNTVMRLATMAGAA